MTIKELEHQIQELTFVEKAQILQFLLHDFTAFLNESSRTSIETTKTIEQNELTMPTAHFDGLAEQLMNAFSKMIGRPAPILSDYAISRAGIYEEHP
ncbi:MAG: hypothetical protein U0350_37375 [Caldilineaceae bacterium]